MELVTYLANIIMEPEEEIIEEDADWNRYDDWTDYWQDEDF